MLMLMRPAQDVQSHCELWDHGTAGEGSTGAEGLALKPQGAGGLAGHTEDKQDVPTSPAEAGLWESREEITGKNNIPGRRAQNRLQEPVGSPSMGREPLQGQRNGLHTEQ